MLNRRTFRAPTLALIAGIWFACALLALNYSGHQKNPATIETLEEARVNGPVEVAKIDGNVGRTFKSHPVLDNYPKGTTFIYRSPNMYGGRAAARINTNLVVFVERPFENKEAALQYMKQLGLIQIIDEALGSVVLVTPANGKTFGAADQKNYYALQTAMFAQKATEGPGRGGAAYSDAEYFGGFSYYYVIGIDGGATFVNNFVANTLDYVSRIAGMLLINGNMEHNRRVASHVPVYLVNAPDSVVERYKQANQVSAYEAARGVEAYFDPVLPAKRVMVAKDSSPDPARYVRDAYYNLFVKALRVGVVQQGLNSASAPYQGYSMDQAPYSLFPRNAIIKGATQDRIMVSFKSEERFSDVKTPNGEYLQTWAEYLPEEVLKNTAPAGTVPLILALHGGGDDPRQFVEEIGLLPLAGAERIAIVAPEHQFIAGILPDVLPRLVRYMLKTYPALDASRVYVTGYSMGGAATLRAIYGDPSLFAAAVPMAAAGFTGTAEQAARMKKYRMPILFMASMYDLPGAFDAANGIISGAYQKQINQFLDFNGMQPIANFDFKTYPICGFKADRMTRVKLNGEYLTHSWYLHDSSGVPMVGVNITEELVHALYPAYGEIAWNFFKNFSRDPKTGAIRYKPYGK